MTREREEADYFHMGPWREGLAWRDSHGAIRMARPHVQHEELGHELGLWD